ncbi:MAG: hypothetical protein C4297_12285 [Gemmataceae bacterium]
MEKDKHPGGKPDLGRGSVRRRTSQGPVAPPRRAKKRRLRRGGRPIALCRLETRETQGVLRIRSGGGYRVVRAPYLLGDE